MTAIEIIGTGKRTRYTVKAVTEYGTNPTNGKAYRTEDAARRGLTRTPDTIENYGEHLYFVFHHDSTWEHPMTEQPD